MKKDAGYTVLARRYRPVAFDEVAGQEHVSRTLKNAIAENRVGHAYLFCGPRGVGKTTMARIFAKALTCAKGPSGDPCGACEVCIAVHEGGDADVIEMDAASNRGVDDARTLRESLRYAPLRARFKIYIIDEAHMLTREAFNTLLKSLEEPPPHVKFFFATTEPHKLPDTIVSRCQRFDFRRITSADIVARLQQVARGEKIEIPDGVLASVARAAKGSMRDAESLLDQLVSYKAKGLGPDDVAAVLGEAGGRRLADLVEALRSGDAGLVFTSLAAIFASGIDSGSFADQLLDRFRALLAVKVCGRNPEVLDLPDADLEECEKQATGFTLEALLYFVQLTLEAKRRIREGSHPRIVLEVALVKMARSADLVPLSEALRPALSRVEGPALSRAEGVSASPARASPDPPAVAPLREEATGPMSPPPAPAFAGTPANTAEAQGAWPRVVAAVKEKSVLAGTLIGEGRVVQLGADELVFALPSKFSRFHADQLGTPKNKSAIEAAVESVFGRRLAIRVELERGGGEAAAKKPPATAEATDDPGVRKILETFGGSRVVGIE